MAVVAGFFDTDDAATRALDDLMRRPGSEDVHTQVISTRSNFGNDSVLAVAGLPETNTTPNAVIAPIPLTGFSNNPLFTALDDDEQEFFHQALKRGGVLALAKVDDAKDDAVRQIFKSHGARVYEQK